MALGSNVSSFESWAESWRFQVLGRGWARLIHTQLDSGLWGFVRSKMHGSV